MVGGFSKRGSVTGDAFSGGSAGAAPFATGVAGLLAVFAASVVAGLVTFASSTLGDGFASGAVVFTAFAGATDCANALSDVAATRIRVTAKK